MRVYLDHNATTQIRPAAKAAVALALELTGNASSVHRSGRAARKLVEAAREQVSALLGVGPAGVVFTSGGTEANNLAVGQARFKSLVISPIEQESVRVAAESLPIPVFQLAINDAGLIDLEALKDTLAEAPAPALVAVMLAALGLDFMTAMSGAASALANVGPGLGDIIGPAGTYAPLPDAAKWLLAGGMLLGRLELFTVIVLFSPSFWRG